MQKIAALVLIIFTALFVYTSDAQNAAYANGGRNDECEDAQIGSFDEGTGTSRTYVNTDGDTVSGVCIKAGNDMFGDGHSDQLSNGTYESGCYHVAGVGTSSVTVSKLLTGDTCKDISHLDIYLNDGQGEPTNTPTSQPSTTPTVTTSATYTPTPTDNPCYGYECECQYYDCNVTISPTIDCDDINYDDYNNVSCGNINLTPTGCDQCATATPTQTPTETPTSTPTPTDDDNDDNGDDNNDNGSDNGGTGGGSSDSGSSSSSNDSGQVLGVNTLGTTGSFADSMTTLMFVMGVALIAYAQKAFILAKTK